MLHHRRFHPTDLSKTCIRLSTLTVPWPVRKPGLEEVDARQTCAKPLAGLSILSGSAGVGPRRSRRTNTCSQSRGNCRGCDWIRPVTRGKTSGIPSDSPPLFASQATYVLLSATSAAVNEGEGDASAQMRYAHVPACVAASLSSPLPKLPV